MRNQPHHPPAPEQPEGDLDQPREHNGVEHVLLPVVLHESRQHDRHGAGGAGDHARPSPEQGGADAHDPGGLEAHRRFHARHEGEGDGLRHLREGDGDAGEDLGLVDDQPVPEALEEFDGGTDGCGFAAAEDIAHGNEVAVFAVIFVVVVDVLHIHLGAAAFHGIDHANFGAWSRIGRHYCWMLEAQIIQDIPVALTCVKL
mmetsp:Transcript_42007/g.82365  ORF Transcript_42007/g.82365 Transcript_42007/m.82365 type:complete len:201 (-) Transcript_42007:55-657(-)